MKALFNLRPGESVGHTDAQLSEILVALRDQIRIDRRKHDLAGFNSARQRRSLERLRRAQLSGDRESMRERARLCSPEIGQPAVSQWPTRESLFVRHTLAVTDKNETRADG